MDLHDRPRFPAGFRCMATHCGLKRSGPDLALFASDREAEAAAVFTRNHFPGAPVVLGREVIREGRLQAVVVNSHISNVGTGPAGLSDARRMAEAAGRALGIQASRVLVSSTGLIGRRLPVERIEAGLEGAAAALQDDPGVGAEAITTTDTVPKAFSVDVGPAVLTLVGKGAGMIAPDMATMLVYAFTDAAVSAAALDRALRGAADVSFHMLSVDTDTSTSDTVAVLANGRAGPVDERRFAGALAEACVHMAERIARDGEGATKLLRATVRGAADRSDARRVARALVESPLVKTMVYGRDPNVGRILMAVGKCVECRVEPERFRATLQGLEVVAGGARADFDEEAVRTALGHDPVDLEVDLGLGDASARAFGCDLTEGYVRENAAYSSS